MNLNTSKVPSPLTIDTDSRMYWIPLLVEQSNRKFNDDFHRHDYVQIWYVLEGEVIHRIGDNVYHMKEGACSVVLPYIDHYLDMSKFDRTPKLMCLSFSDSFLIDHNYRFFSYTQNYAHFEERAVPEFLELRGEKKEISDDLLLKMKAEFDRHKSMNFDVLAAYLAEFLRLFCTEPTIQHGFACARDNANAITTSIRYMKDNISKKISLDNLCTVACMSRPMYTRNFRAITGTNSASFLLNMRLSLACQYLTLSDMKVDEIARRVGLNDKTRLAHTFSAHMQMTPSEYRKKTRALAIAEHNEYLERWGWFNKDDFVKLNPFAR